MSRLCLRLLRQHEKRGMRERERKEMRAVAVRQNETRLTSRQTSVFTRASFVRAKSVRGGSGCRGDQSRSWVHRSIDRARRIVPECVGRVGGVRKSDRSHRSRAVPGRADATRARHGAALRVAEARQRRASSGATTNPFSRLLFSSILSPFPPIDSIWKTTCRNLRRPRSASSVRSALLLFSLSLSVSLSLSPYVCLPVSISFFFRAIGAQLEYRFDIVKPRDWNCTLARATELSIDRGDGGRARDR